MNARTEQDIAEMAPWQRAILVAWLRGDAAEYRAGSGNGFERFVANDLADALDREADAIAILQNVEPKEHC